MAIQLVVTLMLAAALPGSFVDYKLDASWTGCTQNCALSVEFPFDASHYELSFTPQAAPFFPHPHVTTSNVNELRNIGLVSCSKQGEVFKCDLGAVNGSSGSWYVRVRSSSDIKAKTMLNPSFTVSKQGFDRSQPTTAPVAHHVDPAVDNIQVVARFVGVEMSLKAPEDVSRLHSIYQTLRMEMAKAVNQPEERFAFWNVNLVGGLSFDLYVTGPTAEQLAEGSTVQSAKCEGALAHPGSKTGLCSAEGVYRSLQAQADSSASVLRNFKKGDESSWGWRFLAGGIKRVCDDGSFAESCGADPKSDDDLEDAVLIACLVIIISIVLGVVALVWYKRRQNKHPHMEVPQLDEDV